MIVSLNEIAGIARKAARGAGLPAGVDDEVGWATAWLEARGIASVVPLARELAAIARRGGRHNMPLAFLEGLGAIDVAAGRAVRDGEAVTIPVGETVAAPAFALPFVARRSRHANLTVSWRDAQTEQRALALAYRGEITMLATSLAILQPDWPVAMTVTAAPLGAASEDVRDWPVRLGTAGLERTRDRAIAHGVRVDQAAWETLAPLAHKTYVPASEASRLAGAGAGLTDND